MDAAGGSKYPLQVRVRVRVRVRARLTVAVRVRVRAMARALARIKVRVRDRLGSFESFSQLLTRCRCGCASSPAGACYGSRRSTRARYISPVSPLDLPVSPL